MKTRARMAMAHNCQRVRRGREPPAERKPARSAETNPVTRSAGMIPSARLSSCMLIKQSPQTRIVPLVEYHNPDHFMTQDLKSSPGERLKEAWRRQAIQVPGGFNALIGRVAERLGFEAIYLSGAALSASLALPDVGLVTLTEFVDAARSITQATFLPLLCDADTGFGEALNVERTVRLFENAGVAGIHLED